MKIAFYCARYKSDKNINPLGIGYLYSYLKYTRHDLKIVENLRQAKRFNPDVLCISSVSQVINNAIAFAKEFNCVKILGGYHITCYPKLPSVFDIGVIGEGEIALYDIIGKLNKGETIKKMVYGQPANLDLLSYPEQKGFSIFTSRGCPYNCTFCANQAFYKGRVRFRSVDSVMGEIHYLKFRGAKTINIQDDLWIADKKRFRKLAKLCEPLKLKFQGFVRSNLIDEETIVLLKKMGYTIVRFGAETGSERLLKQVKGEGISIADHQRTIDLCKKYDLDCGASFIFGLPGETKEDIKLTVDFLRRNPTLKIRGFYPLNPIPGTKIYDDLGITEPNFNDYIRDFQNPSFDWNTFGYWNPTIPRNEFIEIMKPVIKEFTSKNTFLYGIKKIKKCLALN